LFGSSDAKSDAYVSYESPSGGGLLSCAIGSATCAGTGISVPGAFALAPQYNTTPLTLFVSDIRNKVVDVFHVRHGKTPAAQIHTSGTPYATALDSTFTHLYVANQTASGGLVNEYNYPGGTPLTSFLPPKREAGVSDRCRSIPLYYYPRSKPAKIVDAERPR
jgi:hypothetical protein